MIKIGDKIMMKAFFKSALSQQGDYKWLLKHDHYTVEECFYDQFSKITHFKLLEAESSSITHEHGWWRHNWFDLVPKCPEYLRISKVSKNSQ